MCHHWACQSCRCRLSRWEPPPVAPSQQESADDIDFHGHNSTQPVVDSAGLNWESWHILPTEEAPYGACSVSCAYHWTD